MTLAIIARDQEVESDLPWSCAGLVNLYSDFWNSYDRAIDSLNSFASGFGRSGRHCALSRDEEGLSFCLAIWSGNPIVERWIVEVVNVRELQLGVHLRQVDWTLSETGRGGGKWRASLL